MIVNLTPHPIHIMLESGDTITVMPEPVSARCTETLVRVSEIDGIPLARVEYGEVSGLPQYVPGLNVIYVVSLLVKQACQGRLDLASPADMVRDGEGKIIACKCLALNL